MKELNEKLIEERNELNERIKKLNNFIDKNKKYQKSVSKSTPHK